MAPAHGLPRHCEYQYTGNLRPSPPPPPHLSQRRRILHRLTENKFAYGLDNHARVGAPKASTRCHLRRLVLRRLLSARYMLRLRTRLRRRSPRIVAATVAFNREATPSMKYLTQKDTLPLACARICALPAGRDARTSTRYTALLKQFPVTITSALHTLIQLLLPRARRLPAWFTNDLKTNTPRARNRGTTARKTTLEELRRDLPGISSNPPTKPAHPLAAR